MFDLSFYLTKLVLTAPFQRNATSTTNPRMDTAIEYYPSRRLFCSLTVYSDHHPLTASHLSQYLRQMEAKGKNEERRGHGMGR